MLAIDAISDTLAAGTTGQALFVQPGTLTGTASAATGVLLDFATANTLKVRVPGNSADAALTAGNGTFTGTLTYGGTTLSSTVTGTGALVLATGPSISSLTVTSTLTYGGVTLSSTVTGTGSMVLSAAPSLTGTATFVSASATGNLSLLTGTAIPSVAASAVLISSTANFGIFFGTGTPTITAASQGSLYLNANGSSTSTRLYVFSSASTWINFTSAS